jgi:hypothetical protein
MNCTLHLILEGGYFIHPSFVCLSHSFLTLKKVVDDLTWTYVQNLWW